MFYSQFILAKKGPLGTIWIAAHLERKLRKNQVADTDIGVSVDSILFPEVPIALRLSSHLLLGVVRIYSRKVNYLFDDCSEALLKVKQAFRSTAVDLPPEESTAPYHSITLPETFDLDDFELPDNDIFQGNYVDHHVSTREQITLQDTMDGMVYSTSQFGLDERFGDGDASQIGLDLDEVVLIDKDATLENDQIINDDLSANPQVSHQEDEKKEVTLIDEDVTLEHDTFGANPQVSYQEDDKKEEVGGASDRMQVEDSRSKIDMIDGLPTVTEVNEYAQGPSTPGLEEPNLFGTQVDQVINEADHHNSPDLVPTETTKNESSAHQAEIDLVDCSLQNNGKPVDVDLHHEASDSAVVDSKREEHEHLACTVVMEDQESLIPTDHCLKSVSLTDSSNKDHPTALLPECAGGTIDASDIPGRVEDLYDEVLMNNEPLVTPLDHTFNAVSVNETVASPSSHVTSAQEDDSCKLLPNMDGSRRSEFDGHLDDSNTLANHEVLNNDEISNIGEQPSAVDEPQASNIVSPLGSPSRPEVVDVEARASRDPNEADALDHVSHNAEQPTESHLRPCTSHLSRPSLSSIEAFTGEKCHETDVLDPDLGHHDTVQPSTCEGNVDFEKSDMQFGSQILSNEVGSINKSAAPDMPEPEKLLSLAYERDGEANDFLVGSTPDNHGTSEVHTDAAGEKGISGKKRSYTESTLTMQSMDLVDSYGGAQSTRTAESIPDDDDLLSSILAGRRSSVLRVKPSPAAPEIPSRKRLRSAPHTSASAPRTSALKRKVLMDDMMVLHGDTIRQQLTSTEDIRRIRKKAPCTCHEILMIQRQFLEDEIFQKPIFTDLSADLTIMQNGTFDLSGLKVCDYSLDDLVVEKTNNQESHSRTNTDIHGVEANNEPMGVQVLEDAEAQPTEIPVLSESHHGMETSNEPLEVQAQEDAEAQPTEIPVLPESHHGVEASNEPIGVQAQEDAEAQPTEIPVLSESHHGVEANDEPMEVQPQEDAEAQPTEIAVLPESHHGVEANNEPMEVQPQEDAEAQPTEIPVLSESHQSEVNMGSHDIDAHQDTGIISQLKELVSSQNAEMNNAGDNVNFSAENCSVGPGHETEILKNDLSMPNNWNTFPIPEDELLDDQPDRSGMGAIEISEHTLEIKTLAQTDGLKANNLCASLATGSNEASEYIDNQASLNGDLLIEENNNNMLGGLNEDQIISSGVGCDDTDAKPGGLYSEDTKVDCLHSVTLVDENESSLNHEKNLARQEAASQSRCPDVSAIRSPLEEQNDENDMVANDTEFLNVGDDEIIEDDEYDDLAPSAEGTNLENSGWSSRTRAVSKYLQNLFDKEDRCGRQNLHLDTILAGKTRKEASRMFFETLVLKTKDYVHVEQSKPFAEINIKPRMKLMKSDF